MTTFGADKEGWRAFQIHRLNILMLAGPENSRGCSNADLFAWSSRTYPFFSASILHQGFEDFFHPTKEMMDELSRILDEAFIAKSSAPTVYELERDLGIRHGDSPWTRSTLINALRYMSLCGDRFSAEFWQSMIRNAGAPSEANSFFRPFDPSWDADPN